MPDKMTEQEQLVWDLYFSNIAGFQFHPRNEIKDLRSTLEKCADTVDLMIKIRRERKQKWHY